MNKYILCLLFFLNKSLFAIKKNDAYLYFPVDKNNALPADYEPKDMVFLFDYLIPSRKEIKVRKIIIADLLSMINHAKNDGVSIFITSGYRSYAYQKKLYTYWINKELLKNRSLTLVEAEKQVSMFSAPAGCSEHQLGTALDIIASKNEKLIYSDKNNIVWKWLMENMEKYGFVLSYPEGKTDQTGYIHEPWHIRWIGREKSKEFKEINFYQNIILTDYIKKYLCI